MSAPLAQEKLSLEKKADSVEDKHVDQVDDVHALNVKLANPLQGLSHEQLMADGEAFARDYGLAHLTEEFKKGALIAQNPAVFETLPLLTEQDKAILRRELTHKWDQPLTLYYLVILCSVAAAVQGVSSVILIRLVPL